MARRANDSTRTRSRALTLSGLCALGVIACSDSKVVVPVVLPAPVAPPTEVADTAVSRVVDPQRLRADVEALVARWVEAQNKADLSSYLALYDPKHFVGIKRSHRQDHARELRFVGWKRERTQLFALTPAPVVQVEQLAVKTWLDAGSGLKPFVVEVDFLQRWRGGQYGDHGNKRLVLWRGREGALRIVREDMLDSQVGWDDAPTHEPGQSIVWKAPTTRDDALALWSTLAPTGANYKAVLASIPDDPAIRVPLSRALVAGGNLACREIEEDDECGVTVHRFRPLDPAASLQDACLRRQLLEWAMDVLVATKTSLTTRELRELLSLPMPTAQRDTQRLPIEESDLPHKVLTLSESAAEKVRVSLLLQAGARFPEVARPHLAGLSSAALKTVYEKLHLPEALLQLDPRAEHDYLLSVVANDTLRESELGDSPESIRRAVIGKLYPEGEKGVLSELARELLGKLSEDDDCFVGGLADRVLTAHGEQTRIANAGQTDTREHTLHTLCKLGQAPDRAPLVPLVKDTKHYSEHEYHEDISEAFLDEEGNLLANDPSNIERHKRVGKKALPPTIPFAHRHEIECVGDSCTVSSASDGTDCEYTVGLVPTEAGYRLESIRTKCTSQHYCPC